MVCWECWWRDENGTGLDGLENHPVGEQEMASITSPMAANYKLLKLWSCNSWVLARIQLEWCLAFQVKYQVKGCPSFEAYTPCLPLGANQHCRSSSCKQHTMRPHGPQKRQATQPNILRPDDQQQQTKTHEAWATWTVEGEWQVEIFCATPHQLTHSCHPAAWCCCLGTLAAFCPCFNDFLLP